MVQIMYTLFKYVTFMYFKVIKAAEENITLVQNETAYYRECLNTSSTHLKCSCLSANSTNTAIHMAQQVHIATQDKLGKEEAFKSHSILY